MRVPAKPDLYSPDGEDPALRGTRCGACRRVTFPPLTIGCDACGGPEEQLEPATLAMAGAVHSIATVHRHRSETAPAFVVAEIRLDDGPLIRAMIAAGAGDELRIGDRVQGTWQLLRVDDDGNDVVEPAFTKAG